jgi:hypothetical protein
MDGHAISTPAQRLEKWRIPCRTNARNAQEDCAAVGVCRDRRTPRVPDTWPVAWKAMECATCMDHGPALMDGLCGLRHTEVRGRAHALAGQGPLKGAGVLRTNPLRTQSIVTAMCGQVRRAPHMAIVERAAVVHTRFIQRISSECKVSLSASVVWLVTPHPRNNAARPARSRPTSPLTAGKENRVLTKSVSHADCLQPQDRQICQNRNIRNGLRVVG